MITEVRLREINRFVEGTGMIVQGEERFTNLFTREITVDSLHVWMHNDNLHYKDNMEIIHYTLKRLSRVYEHIPNYQSWYSIKRLPLFFGQYTFGLED